MNVLVVGLGSMGKRRIRLMLQVEESLNIIGVDSNEERCTEIEHNYGIKCYKSLEDTLKQNTFDCSFVCTAPLSHSRIIIELLNKGINVFTEINLVSDHYQQIIDLAKNREKTVFLSSTFLYRKDIQYIINRVQSHRVNYQYHSGQYLPDWHPWEDYNNFFVADKKTNGCREILTIELPWIIKCFGKISKWYVLKDKMSNLRLDYNDNYLIMLEHENGNRGQIIVDIVSRLARRNLEVYGEDLQLFWGGAPDSLKEYFIDTKETKKIVTYEEISRIAGYCDNIIENAYLDEIITFFAQIQGDASKEVMYDLNRDIDVLNIIDKIEEI